MGHAGLIFAATLLVAAPAAARVEAVGPDGFVSANEALVPLPPAQLWAALINWSGWWDPAHSYGGKPGGVVLEPRAGGRLQGPQFALQDPEDTQHAGQHQPTDGKGDVSGGAVDRRHGLRIRRRNHQVPAHGIDADG